MSAATQNSTDHRADAGSRDSDSSEKSTHFVRRTDIIPFRRWVMAVMLVVLNLVDVLSTKLVLQAGGEEANPLMEPIIDNDVGVVVLKSLIPFAAGVFFMLCPTHTKAPDRAMTAILALYSCVVVWNFSSVI